MALAFAMLPSFATDYKDNLEVSLNGVPSPSQQTTISVNDNGDGTYNFSLKDFSFSGIPIGDINLDSIRGIEQDGEVYLADSVDLNMILYGTPMTLPVTLRAELLNNKSKLYASIDVTVAMLNNQKVKVTFGDKYQIPNSGFETFQDYTVNNANVQEATSWHSFASAKGEFAAAVNVLSAPHTFKSSFVRPESFGKSSLLIASTSVFGITANGTVTTGRMNCGAPIATDPQNHAEMEINDSLDAHGDPFYATLNGQPDSLEVWYAFKQGTPSAAHPYATVNAIITDGTYYQDPEDKAYTNKRAQAQDNKIATTYTNGQPVWKKLSIPFNIIDKSVNGKAILVTISTNADAGQGSLDTLYVDDVNLVYNDPTNVNITFNEDATAATVTPDDITVTWDGALGARVVKDLKQEGDSVIATVTVYNGNLTKQIKKATHVYKSATTAINGVTANGAARRNEEVFDISGRRVNTMTRGNVYIVKSADGKTFKVAK